MDSNKKLKDAMLFNILSYMNHKLLTCGNTVAVDSLYTKTVPSNVREFIDLRAITTAPESKRRKPKPPVKKRGIQISI